jgi:hypothetical protein
MSYLVGMTDALGFFVEMGVLLTFCLGCHGTAVFLISASWVAESLSLEMEHGCKYVKIVL